MMRMRCCYYCSITMTYVLIDAYYLFYYCLLDFVEFVSPFPLAMQ